MNRYIDTHAHYADEAFDTDRDELIKKMFESGVVCIIDPAVDLASSVKALGIARNYNNYYSAAGIHPHEAGGATEEDYNKLSCLIKADLKSAERKIVAVGETGLDYHYDLFTTERHMRIVLRFCSKRALFPGKFCIIAIPEALNMRSSCSSTAVCSHSEAR